jgi:hypothetical protein
MVFNSVLKINSKSLLIILLLALVLINFNLSQQGNNKKQKRYNPYKTKEKIEQEEEFDEPELLDPDEVKQKSNNLNKVEEPEADVEDKKPSISNSNVESSEEGINNYKHSEELEIEASRQKMLFQIFTIYEIIMIGFVVLFLITCFTGKSTNDSLATKWFNNNKSFFIENYAHIGTESQYNIDSPMLKESYNNFKFYASGRENINFTLISIDLAKRQDLVSLATSLVLPMERDRVIYELSINSSDIPHVFCICRKKEIKYMKKTYNDIDFMTKAYEPDFINLTGKNKSVVLLTEDDEITDKIFDANLRRLYEAIEPNVDIIYFTDRQTYTKEQYSLFCSFYVDNMKNSKPITVFVHALADKLANVEFNTKKKLNSEKLRKEYIEFIDKENQKKLKNSEEEAERKAAQEAKKKSEVSKKVLTREQMIKLEEKEKKEKMKKQRQKQIKVMK